MGTKRRTVEALEADPEPPSQLDEIIQGLDFSPEDVVTAAANQAKLFKKAADYRIDRMRYKASTKMLSETIWAERSIEIRREASGAGEKLTEKALEAQLTLDPEIRKANSNLAEAEIQDEYSKLLLEAYRMRRDGFEVIGQLAGSGIAAQRAAEMESQRMSAERRKLGAKYKS